MFKNRKQKNSTFFMDILASFCFSSENSYYKLVNIRSSRIDRGSAKDILTDWKIYDKESAKQILDWLLYKGFKEEFASYKNALLFLSERERDHYIDAILDKGEACKASIARMYMNRLPEASISAFDYSFCILLSQCAKKRRYLSKKDSLDYQLKAAKKAQEMFSTWTEYTTSYMAGIQFIQENEEEANKIMKNLETRIIRLLTSKRSPLREAAWNTEVEAV